MRESDPINRQSPHQSLVVLILINLLPHLFAACFFIRFSCQNVIGTMISFKKMNDCVLLCDILQRPRGLPVFCLTFCSDFWMYRSLKHRGLISRANYTEPSDRRLSTKLLPIFVDRGATWSAHRIPTAVFSVFYTGAATISST
jgi:hypothetical protein